MSYKYNDHITIPDDLPDDTRNVLGIWKHNVAIGSNFKSDLVVWINVKNETKGWYIDDGPPIKIEGWDIELYGMPDYPPDLYDPNRPAAVCECGGASANTTHSHWCPAY